MTCSFMFWAHCWLYHFSSKSQSLFRYKCLCVFPGLKLKIWFFNILLLKCIIDFYFFFLYVGLSVCPLSCASLYEISISNCLCDGMLVMCQCVCMFLWWCEKLVDNMERKHKYICILLKGIVKLCNVMSLTFSFSCYYIIVNYFSRYPVFWIY